MLDDITVETNVDLYLDRRVLPVEIGMSRFESTATKNVTTRFQSRRFVHAALHFAPVVVLGNFNDNLIRTGLCVMFLSRHVHVGWLWLLHRPTQRPTGLDYHTGRVWLK